MTNRTILIGLDGATFSILEPLMRDGVMPFLKRFAGSGVHAELRSVVPPLTPPAWTSLMTGRSPGYHGIFDFFQPESAGSRYLRFASSNDVACETIWSLVSRHGLTVTALNFPLTFPPPQVNGSIVPGGWMPWKQLRLGCYPPGLYDRLKALPGFNARELAMDMTVEEKALEGCRDEEYEEWIGLHMRREQHWFEIAHYLMREDPSDLTAILFDGVDKLQHLCWPYLDTSGAGAALSDRDRSIRDLCLDYFRQLDRLMERIVDLGGPEASVVIASDHGFGPTVEVFYVNTWLEQNGYLAWAEEVPRQEGAPGRGEGVSSDPTPVLGMADLARHAYRLDWARTTVYAATPSSNGIHIVMAGPDTPGVPAADYERFRAELAERLRGVTDPASGAPIVSGIWTREDAFAGPRGAIAPDLTLALRDGGLVSILPAPGGSDGAGPVRPRAKASGAHRPEGVFLAAGPAIRSGGRMAQLSILDVAPTILYSLGLPTPDDLEGQVPDGIFDATYAPQAHPTRDGAPVVDHAMAAVDAPAFDAEAEAVVLARLRTLGYVE